MTADSLLGGNMSNTVTVLLNSVRDIVFDVTDNAGKTRCVRINGSGSLIRNTDGTVRPSAPLPGAGAYGITTGVDAGLWAAVEKTYGSMSIFQKGFIKATTQKTEEAAKAELSEKANGEEPKEPQEQEAKKRGGRKKASE
jgi:hypothetical protein